MSMTADTLERIDPDAPCTTALQQQTRDLHLERYRLAQPYAENKSVLDIACGCGYGSAILGSAVGSTVVGVDIDPAAVAHAATRYRTENVRFFCGDATNLALEPVDLIVSFETVEHVPQPGRLVRSFAELLEPGGRLIASAPTTPSVDLNPFHLHDFTRRTFRALITGAGLEVERVVYQRQRLRLRWLLQERRLHTRLGALRSNLLRYYLGHPRKLVDRTASLVRHGLMNEYMIIVARRGH